MTPPDKLSRGPVFLQEAFNALRDFILTAQPLPSESVDIHEQPGVGRQIRAILPPALNSNSSGGGMVFDSNENGTLARWRVSATREQIEEEEP